MGAQELPPCGSWLTTRLTTSAVALMLLGNINGAAAAEWEFTPTITLGETYTDNLTLAPEGQEQDDFITQVNPGLSLQGRTARVAGRLDYLMQNLFYINESGANQTFHQLEALGSAELWPEHLFIDASSSVTQNIIDPDQSVSFSNRSVTGNRTDVITAGASPYFRQEFGSTAQALARYRYGVVEFDDDEVGDLTSDASVNGGWLGIGSQPDEGSTSWLVAYQNEHVNRQGTDANAKFERAGARVDYQVVRPLDLVALGGYENNDFDGATGTLDDAEDPFWEVGVGWEPGARDRIEARYGERFFGDTLFFSWNHIGRRFRARVSYREDVTTLAQSLLGGSQEFFDASALDPRSRGGLPRGRGGATVGRTGIRGGAAGRDGRAASSEDRTAGPGNLTTGPFNGVDPDATGTNLPLGGLTLSSDVFVAERLDATLVFNTAKTTTTVNVYNEDRQFEGVGEDERLRGAGIVWDWAFAARTDFFVGGNYTTRNSEDDDDDEFTRFRVGFGHDFGPRTFGRLAYARARARSEDESDEYVENAVTVSVTRAF